MKFKMVHENYNVADLDRSLAFYEKALGLTEKEGLTEKALLLPMWEMQRVILSWS